MLEVFVTSQVQTQIASPLAMARCGSACKEKERQLQCDKMKLLVQQRLSPSQQSQAMPLHEQLRFCTHTTQHTRSRGTQGQIDTTQPPLATRPNYSSISEHCRIADPYSQKRPLPVSHPSAVSEGFQHVISHSRSCAWPRCQENRHRRVSLASCG